MIDPVYAVTETEKEQLEKQVREPEYHYILVDNVPLRHTEDSMHGGFHFGEPMRFSSLVLDSVVARWPGAVVVSCDSLRGFAIGEGRYTKGLVRRVHY